MESEYELDSTSLLILYSVDNFASEEDTLDLVYSEEMQKFTAELIPGADVENIQYYVKVRDIKNRIRTAPSKAPDELNVIKIGPDTEKPIIASMMKALMLISINTPDSSVMTCPTANRVTYIVTSLSRYKKKITPN